MGRSEREIVLCIGSVIIFPALSDEATYPNPSNGPTTIMFNSDHASAVTLTLTPIKGTHAYTLLDKQTAAEGANELSFDTSALPAGMYFYQLSDDTHTIQTGKLVVVK